MPDDRTLAFETLQIHAGAEPDPATGARQVPIYQTTAYVFRDADHAAKLFNLQEVGYIYSRLTNPTVSALANRVVALEGGAGGDLLLIGSRRADHGAFPADGPGPQHRRLDPLYGGTMTQFSQTIKRFGWSAKFVDFDDPKAIEKAIDADTRAHLLRNHRNPGGYITDLDAMARVATRPTSR
jgi:O-acetylhomoserine (thiol)-lyase